MSREEATGTGALSVGQVVGVNLRRLREQHGETQADASRRLRTQGLEWTRANVASLESGRRDAVDLAALLLLSAAYDQPLSAWFQGAGNVDLGSDQWIDLRDLVRALSGDEVVITLVGERVELFFSGERTEADVAIAERLGASLTDVIRVARQLWGHTATEEREARLGDVSSVPMRTAQARRGHTTRQLAEELRTAISQEEQS